MKLESASNTQSTLPARHWCDSGCCQVDTLSYRRAQEAAAFFLLFICLTHSIAAHNATATNAAATIPPEKWDRLKQAAEGDNAPITFLGKVIDQDDKPLPGAMVILRVQKVHFSPQYFVVPEYVRKETTTDTDGRFSLDNISGSSLDIVSLTKPGYELEPNVKHNYGTISGSIDKPMIFRMWLANIHEQLIAGQKSFHIVPNGTPYVIDLTKGMISESGKGDLKVWIKYVEHPIRGQTNDWSCKIEVINGGLLEEEHSDSSMYSAPVNGYAPAFQLQQQIKGGQYGSIGTRRFYVMLRNGQEYGRMTIELNAPFNNKVPGLIRLEYAINPSGSRVLRP